VLYPETRFFINWSYVRSRPAVRAFALTIFLLSSDVAARLKSGGVDRDVRGYEGASDHAPVWITLKKN
jgi:exonuclease III